jgi:signal transduction histidine kinase
MADAYSNIGEVGAAGSHYKVALGSLFTAYDLYSQLKDTERLAYTSYEISRVYNDEGNDDEAVVFALNTLKDIETDKYNEYDRAKYYINAGDIYKKLSDFTRAILMTRHGLAIAQHIHHREDVRDAWQTLAGIYALQHRYDSAYYYHTLYSALKDSISNDHIQQEIEEIDAHYAVDKKDKEIALKSAQLARQSLLKNVFLYSFVFLVAFTLLLYSRRRIKQRADEEERLNRQRNDLFGAIIMTQENERKRIAQDIHDTLGSLLSAAKLNLSALDEANFLDNPEQARKYRTSLLLLDQVSTELRNIAHNIMPAGLSKIGLPEAVKGLLDTLSAPSGLKIIYNAYGFEERLSEGVEISIYRVLLELINNVIKHARATLLTIQMIRYPHYINIVVEDNGIGFQPEDKAGQGKGMGLGNILSRIQYLKGTMDIDSKDGAGTTILIEVPC